MAITPELANDMSTDAFADFFAIAEPRLRRALIARHGNEVGREATVDALTHGWLHWERVRSMTNPIGYLYRIGANSHTPQRVTVELQPSVDYGCRAANRSDGMPWIEPELENGLNQLTEQQRVTVVLRHGFDWTLDDIAQLLDISISSVRNHLDRGMNKLRNTLEATP